MSTRATPPDSPARAPSSACRPARARDGRRRTRGAQLRLEFGRPKQPRGRPRGRSGKYVPHLTRPRVTKHGGVHVTLRLVAGLPSLRRPRVRAFLERVFVAERLGKGGFRLVHWSIRSNHLHLVCEADNGEALSRGVQRLASRIARRLNGAFGRTGRFFADRFHGRVFTTPRQARNVLRYVLCNEHKDRALAGVAVVGIDPYTSGLHFDGWDESERARLRSGAPARDGPPAVAPASSWILASGWKQHGLLRTDEYVPKARNTPRRGRSR